MVYYMSLYTFKYINRITSTIDTFFLTFLPVNNTWPLLKMLGIQSHLVQLYLNPLLHALEHTDDTDIAPVLYSSTSLIHAFAQ